MVDFLGREGRLLKVKGLDALNGSPLLDIKPYSGSLDAFPDARIGWFRDREIPCDEEE